MLKDELFRWSLVFQENAGTNIKKYIAQYVRAVLFNHSSMENLGLSSTQISTFIENDFEISFHYEEILSSVKLYGSKYGIKLYEEKIYLDDSERNHLNQKLKTQDSTEFYVQQYIDEFKLEIQIDKTVELINRFIYYVFEKNKNYFISIDENKKIIYSSDIDDFQCDFQEKRIINSFLDWDNYAKNHFLYRVITSSFNYGLITLKKKSQVNIFKGKNFYLDANVIIPLSGIGNETRKQSIKAFYDKCIQNNINLCVTEETMHELSNLITKKTHLLNYYANNGKPCERTDEDIFKMGSLEDFYDYYVIWSKKNNYKDLKKFQEDLRNAIFSVVSSLKAVNFSKKEYMKMEEFDEFSKSLASYKKDAHKSPTQSSVSTDTLNLIHVKLVRDSKGTQSNIYDVEDYIVSLDNNFRKWSSNYSPFIPFVMHPLDWLTLLYKYSGRTDNDYVAFCKFLMINDDDSTIDFEQVLININELTSDVTIKRKLIENIASLVRENCNLSEIDIKEQTSKAFDQIVKELDEQHRRELETKDKENETKVKNAANNIIKDQIEVKATEITNKKMKKYEWIENNGINITKAITIILFLTIIAFSVMNNNFSKLLEKITQNFLWSYFLIFIIAGLFGMLSNIITRNILSRISKNKDELRTKILSKTRHKICCFYDVSIDDTDEC